MIAWVEPGQALPSPAHALAEPNGLIAAGRDLSGARLLEAYCQGIFPWYSQGQPVLWWSPDPRMVLFVDEFRLHRSLAQTLRKNAREDRWQVTVDRAFRDVMWACAEPRADQDGTWITPDIVAAYGELHARGYAHSLEVWADHRLVGGLYGVSIGRMFFGESMFARQRDASKCALAVLVSWLKSQGVRVIDCQQATSHLSSLGARPIDRPQFLSLLAREIDESAPDWSSVAGQSMKVQEISFRP